MMGHLLSEEVVEFGRDALTKRALILVVHSLMQSGQLFVFNLLCFHFSIEFSSHKASLLLKDQWMSQLS